MALQGPIGVDFGQVFPHGAFVVGEVEPVADFDRSTREKPVQQVDKATGVKLWQVPVMDGDESVRAKQKTVTVKIAAEVQPVPPDAIAGLPFRPVEFDGLTVTPYVDVARQDSWQGCCVSPEGESKAWEDHHRSRLRRRPGSC